jgi:antirestriction protein ArdC
MPALAHSTVLDIADKLKQSSRCAVIETTEGRAYYNPRHDNIHVPRREMFLGSDASYRAQSFVRTLAHEMTHSTLLPLKRDTSDYAREELVAELGAMFICSDLHVPMVYDTRDPHFESHAAYLQSWCRDIADKPEALFTAAS